MTGFVLNMNRLVVNIFSVQFSSDPTTGKSSKTVLYKFRNKGENMGERELADVTLAMKYEHYDRGFCKYKNDCPKVHPNINCQGNCDDKELVKIDTKYCVRIVQHVSGSLVNFSMTLTNWKGNMLKLMQTEKALKIELRNKKKK